MQGLLMVFVAVLMMACGSAEAPEGFELEGGTGGMAPEATGGAPSATGGAAATGGSTPATGGTVSTGGALPVTGGAPAATGGQPPATGGMPAATGGAAPSTGGVAATGGAPATGGATASPWLPGGSCTADAAGCYNRYDCHGIVQCVDGVWGKCMATPSTECPRACLTTNASCPL